MKKFDRAFARDLAEKNTAEMRAVAEQGGNPDQAALDQRDRIEEMVSDWSEEDQTAFYLMYADELNACSAQTMREVEEIKLKTENKLQSAEFIGQIIGAVILVGFIVFMYQMLT